MQLIYFSHSYRSVDDEVNEFFQDLMVDEGLTPSLDPPSDRLNAAKPERHLRCTDAMVVVLTERDSGPSEYIRWEIGLGLRGRKPQLVLVEDTLPDDAVSSGILQQRFSRRRLLREVREHRHALQALKTFVGKEPPPSHQILNAQRRCVIIGADRLGEAALTALRGLLIQRRYSPVVAPAGASWLGGLQSEEVIQRAALCIAVVEGLSPSEYYLLGAARASLTPTITLTLDAAYAFSQSTPREYQPRQLAPLDVDALLRTVEVEIDMFDEDYLELKEEGQIHRYKAFRDSILRKGRGEGSYANSDRERIVNYIQNAEIDMSKDKIEVSHVVGPVNIKSRLDHVNQQVQQSNGWPDDQRQALSTLVEQLQAELAAIADKHPDEADRITRTTELVVSEATKPKPDKAFLNITAEGLKQAAKALADIAPTVLLVAGKVAEFVTRLA
jgi:hypothetical protein